CWRSSPATSSPPAAACTAATVARPRCGHWARWYGSPATSKCSTSGPAAWATGRCSRGAPATRWSRSTARASPTTGKPTSPSTPRTGPPTRWSPRSSARCVRSCPPPEEGRPRPAVPSPLISRLAERPLLCDGAMGTLLYARGVALDACFDVLNLNEAKLVQSVHSEYIAAGCDAIETNTFGANRFKLG